MENKRDNNKIAYYKRMKGCTCVNCGSVIDIEYHHIVPLTNGGNDILSNIVPLCRQCHYNAHDKIYKFENQISPSGRPRKVDKATSDLWCGEWLDGNICTYELYNYLGIKVGKNGRINNVWEIRALQEYIEENGIDKTENELRLRKDRLRMNKEYRKRVMEKSEEE